MPKAIKPCKEINHPLLKGEFSAFVRGRKGAAVGLWGKMLSPSRPWSSAFLSGYEALRLWEVRDGEKEYDAKLCRCWTKICGPVQRLGGFHAAFFCSVILIFCLIVEEDRALEDGYGHQFSQTDDSSTCHSILVSNDYQTTISGMVNLLMDLHYMSNLIAPNCLLSIAWYIHWSGYKSPWLCPFESESMEPDGRGYDSHVYMSFNLGVVWMMMIGFGCQNIISWGFNQNLNSRRSESTKPLGRQYW